MAVKLRCGPGRAQDSNSPEYVQWACSSPSHEAWLREVGARPHQPAGRLHHSQRQLKVGSATQQVTVTRDVLLLKTDPQVTQDWENFIIPLPGAIGTVGGSQGAGDLEVSLSGFPFFMA